MEISVSKHRESMVDQLVQEGRFSSASEVVEEGLRLVEEQQKKLQWLRSTIQKALDDGGDYSDKDIRAALDAEEARIVAEGA